MKNTFFLAGLGIVLLSTVAHAQDTQNQSKNSGNKTVDSIISKYNLTPMPAQITTEQIFPVIGQYQSNNDKNEKITVALDEQNKGLVWIDGLPQGKIKAILKKSPSTYKIPAQKVGDKDIAEGTLIYDKDTKTISIMIGRPFDNQNPNSVFTTAVIEEPIIATKTKKDKVQQKVKKEEPWVFTGTKIEQVTAINQ
jgi:hypothetical protein